MNRLAGNLRFAGRSLREQRWRSVLSMLGVLVASVCIVLLVSIAQGVRQDLAGQIRQLGVNVLVVVPARIEDGLFNPNLGGQSFLEEGDARRLLGIEGVIRAAPFTFAGGGVRFGEQESYPMVIATTDDWFAMRPVVLQEGRVFGGGERQEPVCVIGSVAKEALFGDRKAVGQRVTVNGRDYLVVGVTREDGESQSLFSFGGFENAVYIPYHSAKRENPTLQTDRIMVQSVPEAEPKALVQSIERVLGERLDRQQYSVLTQEDLLGLVYKLMNILTWLLTGLTSIALFVGGVGIMTVMLMSVNERVGEIGLRKTVGARRSDIFSQFLLESAALGAAGGVGGLASSAVICSALERWTPIKPLITAQTVTLSLLVCVGVGVLFGLLPAMNAARKQPVEALRG
jgi:putative ABC transport system permease protein